MNLLDSSGWLEFFMDGGNASHFAKPLADFDSLIVPTISIYEVYKVALREKGEPEAFQILAAMQRGQVIDLTLPISLKASSLSLKTGLPMADSVILATAHEYDATLWTQDEHFKGFESVKYFKKE